MYKILCRVSSSLEKSTSECSSWVPWEVSLHTYKKLSGALSVCCIILHGLLQWLRGKEPPASAGDVVQSLGQEGLPEKVATHPVFLPGKLCGLRSLTSYSPWGHKSRTQLSN